MPEATAKERVERKLKSSQKSPQSQAAAAKAIVKKKEQNKVTADLLVITLSKKNTFVFNHI